MTSATDDNRTGTATAKALGRSFLVLGTGELGEAVLRSLIPRAARDGVGIDVLVRSGAGAGATLARSAGAQPVALDVAAASVAELASVFGRYDTVVSCIGYAAGPGTQLKLAHAALASGTRRYFPWQFGADYDLLGRGSPQPLFDEQLDVRDLLRAQHRLHWVIISVGMFTSFLFESSFGVVELDRRIVRALGGWGNAVTVTTPQDIGRLTTEIILAEPELADEVVHLAGDTLTYGQLADIVERVLGRPVTREVLPIPDLMADLARDPDDVMRRYRAVFALGRGMWWDKDKTFNARRGITVMDAEGWLRTHLAARMRKDAL